MATSSAGIAAAYATEINSCSFNVDAGTRTRSRPQKFCDSVTIDKTLDVASTATFAVPIEVTEAVIVDGTPYKPAAFTGLGVVSNILTANGLPIGITAPSPPSTFTNITITGTLAVTGTGELDAGTY